MGTDGGGGITWYNSKALNVNLGDSFTLDSANGVKTSDGKAQPKAELGGEVRIRVYNPVSTVIEDIKLKTDCSQAINLGDNFGGFGVTALASKLGGYASNCADVDYTYSVTANGVNVTCTDDQLGPIGTFPGTTSPVRKPPGPACGRWSTPICSTSCASLRSVEPPTWTPRPGPRPRGIAETAGPSSCSTRPRAGPRTQPP